MIRPSDIGMFWFYSHVISRISWYVPLYHGTYAAVPRQGKSSQYYSVQHTMLVLALLLIPGKTAGRAAGFSRSTSGCGATGGHFQERFRSRLQRRCAGTARERVRIKAQGSWKKAWNLEAPSLGSTSRSSSGWMKLWEVISYTMSYTKSYIHTVYDVVY